MAILTFTAANVLSDSAVPLTGVSGASISAGHFLYADATDSGKMKLAINTSSAAAAVVGIAVDDAESGQPVGYVTGGTITVQTGAFTNKGEPLVLSSTAGKCELVSDRSTGDFVTIIGYSLSGSTFKLDLGIAGVTFTAN